MDTTEFSYYLASWFVPAVLIVFFYGVLQGYMTGKTPNAPDWLEELREGRFNLGYVEDDPIAVEFVKVEAVADSIKQEKKAHTKEFVEDCVSVLVGLGSKRTVAKKDVTDFLNKNPEIQTIDEFVKGVMKK